MKESLKHIDDRILFRDTFQSEQNTRKIGGVPTNIEYSNGQILQQGTSGSKIVYPRKVKSGESYTVRVKLSKFTLRTSAMYFFAQNASSVSVSATGLVSSSGSSGIVQYQNGEAVSAYSTTSLETELVFTITLGSTFLDDDLNLLNATNGFGQFQESTGGKIELFEIYKGTLTAEEVKNLYEGKTYHELSDKISDTVYKILDVHALNGVVQNKFSGDIIPDELVTNGTFDTNTDWTIDVNSWVISGGKVTYGTLGYPTASASDLKQAIPTPENSKVLLSYEIVENTLDTGGLTLEGGSFGLPALDIIGIPSTVGKHTIIIDTITYGTSQLHFTINGSPTSGILSMDNISVKEIVPDLILTDITTKKIGSNVWSPDFNLSTSKIDCGNFDDLTGDITVFAWVNLRSLGVSGGSNGRIITNGKLFMTTQNISGGRLLCTSDNVTLAFATFDSSRLNKDVLVTFRRNSNGLLDLFLNLDLVIDGVSSGTPTAGTTNITIGNLNAGGGASDGKIPRTVIYKGLLSNEQIAQFHTNTKRYFK